MKANEVMTHQNLFSAISEVIRFNLTEEMFKSRIEYLLDSEYIDRNKDKKNEYVYVK